MNDLTFQYLLRPGGWASNAKGYLNIFTPEGFNQTGQKYNQQT